MAYSLTPSKQSTKASFKESFKFSGDYGSGHIASALLPFTRKRNSLGAPKEFKRVGKKKNGLVSRYCFQDDSAWWVGNFLDF